MSKCNLEIVYTNIEWAEKITQAEKDCVRWLKERENIFKNKIALDIGIGASHFQKELCSIFSRIDGLTVIDEEIKVGQSLGDINYHILKQNKYNTISLDSALLPEYDAVVDVNPKQYGCCHAHWEEYFLYILTKVKDTGVFLTHTTGFGCYEGFRTEQLSIEELTILSSRQGMTIKTYPSPVRENHNIVAIGRHGR